MSSSDHTSSGSDASTGSSPGPDDQKSVHKLTGVIDGLKERTEGQDEVRVQDLFEAFAGRLFGPIIAVVGLSYLTPLGGIPMYEAAAGIFVALIAIQRVFGRTEPWTPKRLRERSLGRERVVNAFEKVRPWTKRVDMVFKPRLTVLTEGKAEIGAAVLATLLGLSIIIIGAVPMAGVLPGTAIALIGLAMIARDGAVMVVAYLLAIGAGYFFYEGMMTMIG